jgi:hypothetical protein
MPNNDTTDSGRSDPRTTVSAGLLALAGAAGVAFCLVYAIWWLLVYWAPW